MSLTCSSLHTPVSSHPNVSYSDITERFIASRVRELRNLTAGPTLTHAILRIQCTSRLGTL